MLGTNIHPDCRGLSVYARIVPLGRGRLDAARLHCETAARYSGVLSPYF